MRKHFLLIVVLSLFAVGQPQLADPVVRTYYGQLQGRTYDIAESGSAPLLIDVFFGIPDAQPPVGALRFEAFTI